MIVLRNIIYILILWGALFSISWGITGDVSLFPWNTPEVFAASIDSNGPETPVDRNMSTQAINVIVTILNSALSIVTMIVTPLIMFISWLLSPDWTSGDLFGLREPMYQLWTVIANIVYVIYAIMIILIALATMFNSENYGYKKLLPKLALGIIMVPFTWWFIQWTISLASVVTASVITIPQEAVIATNQANWSHDSFWMRNSIPKVVTVDGMGLAPLTDTINNLRTDYQSCEQAPDRCIAPMDIIRNASGMYGYMVIYAYSIFKIHEVQDLQTTGVINLVKTITDVFQQSIISLIMLIVFGFLVIALAAMLLIRGIMLWVYAIFSPLFSFKFVAGKVFGGDDNGLFDIKQFLGLAFVPAIVSLALSMGLLVAWAVQQWSATVTQSQTCDPGRLRSSEGCTIAYIMGNPENTINRRVVESGDGTETLETSITIGGFEMKFLGRATSLSDVSDGANNIVNMLDTGGGIFGTMIVNLIGLVFIWVAFMAAKNISKVASAVAKPFEEVWGQVKNMAMKGAEYIPLPGVGSVGGMKYIGSQAQTIMENKQRDRAAGSAIGQMLGMQKSLNNSLVESFKNAAKINNTESFDRVRSAVSQAIATGQGQTIITSHQDEIEAIRKQWKEHFDKIIRANDSIPDAHKEQLRTLVNQDRKLNMDEMYQFLALVGKRFNHDAGKINPTEAQNIVLWSTWTQTGEKKENASANNTENTNTGGGTTAVNISIGGSTINIDASKPSIDIANEITREAGASMSGQHTESEWRTALDTVAGLTDEKKNDIIAELKRSTGFIKP